MLGFMYFQARYVLVRLSYGLYFECRYFKLLTGARSSELALPSSFLGFVASPRIIQERFRLPESKLFSLLRASIQFSIHP